MFSTELNQAVMDFTALMLPITEKDLERAWKWKDHDEEGLRFAFFVTLQELRHLAAILATAPLRGKPTTAQHILSQYHAAYMDLQAAVLGLSNEGAERAPANGEWSVKQAYAHVLGTDLGFRAVLRYALEGHRANRWTADRIPEQEYPRLYGVNDKEYDELMESPFDSMLVFHRSLHEAILKEFRTISSTELDLPATFWEETRFPIRHRLHRYEAHFAQHTVQIDKTLIAIGKAPTEPQRLLRRIFAALAEVEGTLIGTQKTDDSVILATASSISERVNEIRHLLG